MSNSYKFLAHETFRENIEAFLRKYPEHKHSLFANLERARSNPFSGKPMHSLKEKLRQKVYRLWIGGPKDFRFIYYVDKKNYCVLGIYVTLIPRPEFSYDNDEWLDNLENIVGDLEKQDYDKFEKLNTGRAAKSI